MIYDIIIVGAGPGGLTAAIYGARAGLKVLVADPGLPGGQMNMTHEIQNYPGFPNGIDGFSLGDAFTKQAKKWGAEIVQEKVVTIVPFHGPWQVRTENNNYLAKTVIAAAGARPRPLGIKGEKEFQGKGVSYCGTCDGPLYRNRTVAVIGGGNTALQESDFLSRFAEKIYIIHRRDRFRAQQALIDHIKEEEKAVLTMNCALKEIQGDDIVTGVTVIHNDTGKEETISVDGVFIFVGYEPNTDFCQGLTDTDDNGRIITNSEYQCAQPGLFAIGDIRSKEVYQIANAVGEGAEVVHFIENYIKTHPECALME